MRESLISASVLYEVVTGAGIRTHRNSFHYPNPGETSPGEQLLGEMKILWIFSLESLDATPQQG